MLRRAVLILLALLLLAARPAPSGTFTMSPAPYHEGDTISFTFGPTAHMNRNDEVTLGVWCILPDGSQIPWGNRSNPYIYEFNSFGGFDESTVYLYLPIYGTGYTCHAGYIEADWFKGVPLQAWTLDEENFAVAPVQVP